MLGAMWANLAQQLSVVDQLASAADPQRRLDVEHESSGKSIILMV